MLRGQPNPKPVLVIVREQLASERVTRIERHPGADVVWNIIGWHIALHRRDLVSTHAALVVGRCLQVVGAGGGRRKIQHGVGASAPAIGKIKQMAGCIKHPQIGVGQRAHMAG